MARFQRFQSRLRPVNSVKHIVDQQGATTAGTRADNNLILAVDSPATANVTEVELGSTVNSIYLKVEINATSSAALSNAYLYIMKNPGGNLTTVNGNVLGPSDIKKYVIHQEMVMMQQVTNSNPRTLFVGVIRIPRGYKRFGVNDTLVISLFSPGVNINFCVQCIYKSYK